MGFEGFEVRSPCGALPRLRPLLCGFLVGSGRAWAFVLGFSFVGGGGGFSLNLSILATDE